MALVAVGMSLGAGCQFAPAGNLALGVSAASLEPGQTAQAPIQGRVEWPETRSAQAAFADVARASTVSLIDTVANQVIATTLTTPDLTFVLDIAGFTPTLYKTYYIEALKGLNDNRAGNDALRLRTMIRWYSQTEFSSITVPRLVVSAKTTALCAIANLRFLTPESFIGRINLGPPVIFDANGTDVSPNELTEVADYVDQAIIINRDPLFAIRYETGKYLVDLRGTEEPAPFPKPQPYIQGLSRYYGLPGDAISLYGWNFASPVASNTVTINGTGCTLSAGTTTQIDFAVPIASSGVLVLTTPLGSASANFTIFSPLGGNVGGTRVLPTAAPDKTVVGGVFGRLSGPTRD